MKGFTLIELLVVATVGMIAGALLIQLLVQNNGFFYQQRGKVTEGTSLNAVSQEINQDLKLTSSVAAGYPVISPTILSSATAMVLQIPSVDSSGTVIANTYDYYVFQADSTNPQVFRKIIYPDPASSRKSQNQVLLSSLSRVQFSYFDASGNAVAPASSSKVQYTIYVSTNIGPDNLQDSVTQQVSLRNR